MPRPARTTEKTAVGTMSTDRLLETIPLLAISGEESAVDLILYEVLNFLVTAVGADIGQIKGFFQKS